MRYNFEEFFHILLEQKKRSYEDKWREHVEMSWKEDRFHQHMLHTSRIFGLSLYFCPFSTVCLYSFHLIYAKTHCFFFLLLSWNYFTENQNHFDLVMLSNAYDCAMGALFQKLSSNISSENKRHNGESMSWTCWYPFITHVHTSNV